MCTAVTEREIQDCMRDGARTVDEVGDRSMAGTGCGGCRAHIEMILAAGGALATAEPYALQRTA